MTLRIVRTGTWLYDGTVARPVDIVALDFDWWYQLAEADGDLEPDEKPIEPDAQGWIYYVRFKRASDTSEPTWVDSFGDRTIEEAMSAAQAKVQAPIQWNDGDT